MPDGRPPTLPRHARALRPPALSYPASPTPCPAKARFPMRPRRPLPAPGLRLATLAATFLTLAACATTAPGAAPTSGPFDVVITNGRIVDGTGAPWFHGDIGIRGDRIVRITPRGMLRRRAGGGAHRCRRATWWRRGSSTSRATPAAPSWARATAGHQQGDAGHHHRDHGRGLDQRHHQRAQLRRRGDHASAACCWSRATAAPRLRQLAHRHGGRTAPR
jgi:hypothetical protein